MLKLSAKSFLSFALLVLICLPPAIEIPGEAGGNEKPISNETAHWLLKQARYRLAGNRAKSPAERERMPREVLEPRRAMIFITAYNRGHVIPPRTAAGIGESLASSLGAAVDKISNDADAYGALTPPDRIQIDVMQGAPVPLDRRDLLRMSAAELIDAGLDGIAVETEGRTHYLLPSEVIYKSIVDEDIYRERAERLLDKIMAYLGLPRDIWRSPRLKLSRFRTASFVESSSRDAALKIIRGFLPVEQIDRTRLLTSARSGGDYLIRAQQPDGSFLYLYDLLSDRFNSRSNNILRHAGTAFALFDLYAATRDARYLDSARRAVSFLKTRLRPAREKDADYVLDFDGKAKLGANGLALLALSRQMELDPQSQDRESANRLANQIISMQHKDGSFDSYYRLRGDEPTGSVSLYYPGEAILGLTNLYKLTGEKRLLDAARRGAEYLIESQRKSSKLPPDAWLMQALDALYKINRERKYVEHAIALALSMIGEQYTDDPIGYTGAFRPGLPRSTPSASRTEGLLAAFRMARAVNDSRASKIAGAIKASVRFQLSQQFEAENSFFLPGPERAEGGFRASIVSMRVRIDFVQHNISSLIGAADVLY